MSIDKNKKNFLINFIFNKFMIIYNDILVVKTI
jgi:hypothetical protein